MFFAPAIIIENNLKCLKMSQNQSKAGAIYSPCFLAKNSQKCMFFAPAIIIENN
jgi:hypothetical protein